MQGESGSLVQSSLYYMYLAMQFRFSCRDSTRNLAHYMRAFPYGQRQHGNHKNRDGPEAQKSDMLQKTY